MIKIWGGGKKKEKEETYLLNWRGVKDVDASFDFTYCGYIIYLYQHLALSRHIIISLGRACP